MRVAYAFLTQFTDLYSFLDVVLAIPLRVPRSRKAIAPGASLNDTIVELLTFQKTTQVSNVL